MRQNATQAEESDVEDYGMWARSRGHSHGVPCGQSAV